MNFTEKIIASVPNLTSLYRYPFAGVEKWVVIAPDFDLPSLQKSSKVWRKAPFIFLTESDVGLGADVFPLQYLHMQHHAELVEGQDLLGPLTFQKNEVRWKLEQELRNKLIYLREEYLTTKDPRELLPALLPGMLFLLEALFFLQDLKPKRDFLTDLATLEKSYKISLSCARRLWEEDPQIPKALEEFFQTFHDELLALLSAVDGFKR